MNDMDKTKEQLVNELTIMRQRVAQLETAETKNKQTSQKLKESEELLRDLYENAPIAYFSVGVDGRIRRCNRQACDLLGYTSEELVGRPVLDLYADAPPGKEKAQEMLDRFRAGEQVYSEELQMRKADGTPVWINLTVNAVHNAEGRVLESRSMVIDVTEHKNAEQQLRFQAQLLDSVRESVIATDLEGHVVYWGKGAEALYGYRAEEVMGELITFISMPDEEEEEKERIREAIEKGQWSGQYKQRHKDGFSFWADTMMSLVTDEVGNPSGLIGINRDITERKEAEEALQQHNRNLALLNQVGQVLIATLELSQVFEQLLRAAIEITDAEGSSVWLWDEDQVGELVCRAILTSSQYQSPRDFRVPAGQGIAGWVAQRGESAVIANVQEDPRFFRGIDEKTGGRTTSLLAVPLKMRDHVSGVLEVVNKRGASIENHPPRFNEDDRILVEMLGVSAAIAIDNARLIESLREYGMELESRNQELDAFAHTVAHDLKNPLAHVVALAELLDEDLATMPDDEQSRYLKKIAYSGRKMSNIINELLLLSGVRRMEAVELTPVDMADIVSETLERLTPLINEHRPDIILPESWPVALGHSPWIEEIWVNYLSNAINYGGRPPRIELGATVQPDGFTRFWVRDNGAGLTPEEQAHLFTPFTRLDQVRAKGYGLGLSIVQRIVEKLGGKVGVESDVGHGSIFSFTLRSLEE